MLTVGHKGWEARLLPAGAAGGIGANCGEARQLRPEVPHGHAAVLAPRRDDARALRHAAHAIEPAPVRDLRRRASHPHRTTTTSPHNHHNRTTTTKWAQSRAAEVRTRPTTEDRSPTVTTATVGGLAPACHWRPLSSLRSHTPDAVKVEWPGMTDAESCERDQIAANWLNVGVAPTN